MTDTNNLVIEQLRAIRAILNDHTERFERVENRLSALEHHMAAYTSAQSDFDTLRRRIERIERRLDLTE